MGALAKSKGTPGPKGFAITKPVLKKLEKLGASGLTKRWAAAALSISEDTFIRRMLDTAEFAAAWNRGKAALAKKMMERAPRVLDGLYKNATTPTEAAPGGNVAAQSIFISKVIRSSDGEERQDHVNLEEELGAGAPIGAGQEGGGQITEIQEVRVRRIRRSGRIEDE